MFGVGSGGGDGSVDQGGAARVLIRGQSPPNIAVRHRITLQITPEPTPYNTAEPVFFRRIHIPTDLHKAQTRQTHNDLHTETP